MVLLTPGPCQTSETVRQAAVARDFNHRDPEFAVILDDIRRRLLAVYPTTPDWVAYLLGGSGTAAMEAMAASCIRYGPVLVLENGYYSARMADIFSAHRIECDRMSFGWLDPISIALVEDRLKSRAYEAVVLAHNETTTGRLNPVEAIAGLAHRMRVRCLVDATSSFGADTLDLEHIDAICASGNKCLHGIAGVSFVLASPDMAELMRRVPPRSFYLHLPNYESDSARSTPPVPALLALQQALIEMPGGVASYRREVYIARANRLRNALLERDLAFVVDPAKASCTLTTCQVPAGFTASQWLAANYEKGYVLYGCKGELAESCFQVANMGELTDEQIEDWVAVFRELTAKMGS